MHPAAPISPEQLVALARASKRARKVRRCAGVAAFGGWTAGLFGGISLLMTAFSFSLSGAFIGVALVVAALGEFRGAALVRRFDPRGPRLLAINQLVLGAALVIYAVWCLLSGLHEGLPASAASGNPQVDDMITGIARTATVAVYGTLAVVGGLGPAMTAWYYASRVKIIREFRAETEPSVVEALKAA